MNSREPEPAAHTPEVARALPTPAIDDPFAALDDLMCVIEALCPTWPQRPPSTNMNIMVL
jgi:hypothetical protein